jgi:phosphatidylethanolamine/phosphatidyl-N-methylethanolamine N-methyltransferase
MIEPVRRPAIPDPRSVDTGAGPGPVAGRPDSTAGYERFTLEFFRRWSPYYDLLAGSIAWAYGRLVRSIDLRPGEAVLDVCMGTGQVGLRLARRARVIGIDLSPDMLGRALRRSRSRGGLDLHLVRGDARRLPFAAGTFAVVTLSFALHDMPRRVRSEVLSEVVRVGRRLLVILDYDLPRSSLARSLTGRLIGRYESPYFASFVRQGLADLLREEGLPVESIRRDPSRLFSVCRVPLDRPPIE